MHVGQGDIPAAEVRALLGPGRILGVSVKTVEEAARAVRDGADYLGCGASECPQLNRSLDSSILILCGHVGRRARLTEGAAVVAAACTVARACGAAARGRCTLQWPAARHLASHVAHVRSTSHAKSSGATTGLEHCKGTPELRYTCLVLW